MTIYDEWYDHEDLLRTHETLCYQCLIRYHSCARGRR